MIPGTIPIAGGGLGPPEYSFISSYVRTQDASTHNFSSVSLGAADPNRYIGITLHYGITEIYASSVTVAGEPAVMLERQRNAARTTEIWLAHVPSGTSGTVSVSFSATQHRITIGVYRILNLKSMTPEDTAVGQLNNTSNDISLSGVSPGAIILAAGTGDSSPSFSYSGVTEDYEGGWSDTSGSNQKFAGGSTQTALGGSVSITQTSTGGGTISAVSVALR